MPRLTSWNLVSGGGPPVTPQPDQPAPPGNPGSVQMEPASWSPSAAGLHLDDDQNSRMARSSAALADIARTAQLQLWLAIQEEEDRFRAKAGAFQSTQALLKESVTDAALESLQGHRTLENLLAMLGYPTELLRQLPPEHARAFILESLTSTL